MIPAKEWSKILGQLLCKVFLCLPLSPRLRKVRVEDKLRDGVEALISSTFLPVKDLRFRRAEIKILKRTTRPDIV